MSRKYNYYLTMKMIQSLYYFRVEQSLFNTSYDYFLKRKAEWHPVAKNLHKANEHLREMVIKDILRLINEKYSGAVDFYSPYVVFRIPVGNEEISVLNVNTDRQLPIYRMEGNGVFKSKRLNLLRIVFIEEICTYDLIRTLGYLLSDVL